MKEKKLVEEITSMDEDFPQWYTDIIKKADLVDYSSVKGCMIVRPYGYAIWERIQKYLDEEFKKTGHENVYMPLFIPESLLQKEKDHIEGFAPEVAWVTHGGKEELTEKLCVRPTSEALFCDHFSKIIHSYRDLPKLYNQWCSVVRWEKSTRPFLRTTEFLWQEGHTAHATSEEANEEALKMLNIYADFCENILAIPVIKGSKTDKEKFAGAKNTYTIESLMHDGKALQSGTSHNFGDKFARAFGIDFQDENNNLSFVHQSSWGVSTRIIGALIMVHGDDSGLVLPPKIAPVQVVVIPVTPHKEEVVQKAYEIKERLSKIARVDIDARDKMSGWKFSEHEMRGIPLRLEIGPRDMEKDQVVLVRRDNREKSFVSMNDLEESVRDLLENIQTSLYEKAKSRRDERTYSITDFDEFQKTIKEKPGYIKSMWCGERQCEDTIREKTYATSRCIPFQEEKLADNCICCGKPARHLVYWALAY